MRLIGGILKGAGIFYTCGVIWAILFDAVGFMDLPEVRY